MKVREDLQDVTQQARLIKMTLIQKIKTNTVLNSKQKKTEWAHFGPDVAASFCCARTYSGFLRRADCCLLLA